MKNKKLLGAAIVAGAMFISCNLGAMASSVDYRDVSTPADVNTAIQNPNNKGEVDVNLKNDVTVTGAIGTPNSQYFTVNGNGYALDGQKAGSVDPTKNYAGFIIGMQDLEIRNTILRNFYNTEMGGAINNVGTATIYNSSFSGNKADSGGAIYNEETTTIHNSSFSGNNATSQGGALYNYLGSMLTIYNSNFNDNSVNGTGSNGIGGAICNAGTVNIYNSSFNNNNSSYNGGAIYNKGTLNLIADQGIVEFTGNSSNGYGSYTAIYNDNATVNINAGPGQIIFNDKITGQGGYININAINSTNPAVGNSTVVSGAPTSGMVIFNDTVTGNSINLYSGTLKLGDYNNTKTTSYFDNTASLNLHGGTIDSANGNIDNITVGGFYSNGAKLMLDWGDQYNYMTPNGGTINLLGINIKSDIANSAAYNFFTGDLAGHDMSISNQGAFTAYTNDKKYTFAGIGGEFPDNDKLFLTATRSDITAGTGLNAAVTDTTATRSFSATRNYTAEGTKSYLGYMGGTSLTIFGNQYSINGNGKKGIVIGNGQTLNIFDVGSLSTGGKIDANSLNTDSTDINTSWNGFYNTDSYSSSAININNNGTANIYNSIFKSNTSMEGGAIANNGKANIYNSIFKSNTVTEYGGAIFNNNVANIYNSIFESNTSNSYGGAIYSEIGSALNIYNSTFKNNTAAADGGAIYSNGATVNLIASGDDVTFSGNKSGSIDNDIYLNFGVVTSEDPHTGDPVYTHSPSTLNLNAGLENKISFGGGIKSASTADGIININKTGSATAGDPQINAPTAGEVVLGAPIKTSTINLYGGTLSLGTDHNLDGNKLTLAGGTLNMQNNAAGTMALNALAVTDATNLKIDADLNAGTSDKITGTYSASTDKINVSSIKLINNPTVASASTQFLGDGLKGHDLVSMGVTKAYTPVYAYDVSYNDATGQLNFAGGPGGGGNNYNNYNPSVVATPVAAQSGAYLNQLSSYNQAFQNMDFTMLMPSAQRLAIKNANKYAMLEGGADTTKLQGIVVEDKNEGVWFQPYTTFEKVNFSNGPKVRNIGYGSFFGGDSKMIELKRGWDAVYSGYASYNGSSQSFSGNNIYQNGGQLGTGATFYKGNSFTGITANVGASSGEAYTMYGRDDFNMLSAGFAAKTGHNFEFKNGKFIFQPSYMMSYTFVNTFDYTNAAGVSITSDPINAIQIVPGVKFIANTKSGWQPYFGIDMLWNIMDKAKYYANDVNLPELSIKPYVQYGFGVQKRVGERLTGFGQAMVRNGGRNGVALQFGFRLAVGKNPANPPKL